MAQVPPMYGGNTMTMVVAFDPDDPRYRCCCQNCHSKTGTTILAVINVVLLVVNFLGFIGGGANAGVLGIIILIIGALFVGCLVYGLVKEKHVFLIPYMVYQIIVIVVLFIAAVLMIIFGVVSVASGGVLAAQDAKTEEAQRLGQVGGTAFAAFGGVIIVMGVIYLVIGAVWIWLFTVVLACYRYFKEKTMANFQHPNMAATATYSMPQVNPGFAPAPPQMQPPQAQYNKYEPPQ